MNSTAAPRSRSVRTTANSRSTSGPESAAVGSSMISTRASKLSALAISTICWSAIERPRTGRSGSSRTPRRSSSSWTSRCIAPRSMRRSRAERVAAHHHVLRDAEVREERRLLVDHRDAGVARVVRGVEVDRLAVDEHLARVAPEHAAEHLHERRLAGAVLARSARAPRRGAARGSRRAGAHGAVGLARVAQLDDRRRRLSSCRLLVDLMAPPPRNNRTRSKQSDRGLSRANGDVFVIVSMIDYGAVA